MASEIHENDVGTKLLVTITDDGQVVDISSALALSIFIRKRDLTTQIQLTLKYTAIYKG
jgi:hypothetical protein